LRLLGLGPLQASQTEPQGKSHLKRAEETIYQAQTLILRPERPQRVSGEEDDQIDAFIISL